MADTTADLAARKRASDASRRMAAVTLIGVVFFVGLLLTMHVMLGQVGR